jgi:hypothetical protein
MWEEVIVESPITVAVYEYDESDALEHVHIYRNGLRLYEYLSPEDARQIIAELQELADEREGQGPEF